jgi:hypothetical protein
MLTSSAHVSCLLQVREQKLVGPPNSYYKEYLYMLKNRKTGLSKKPDKETGAQKG